MRGHSASEDARERAYDPRIHPLCTKVFTKMDGLHHNSGLPDLRTLMRRKSGKPDLRVKLGNDGGWINAHGGGCHTSMKTFQGTLRKGHLSGCLFSPRHAQSSLGGFFELDLLKK
jgi:hypothetical protein